MNDSPAVVGILGAGKLGITLAQLSLQAGYRVYISGSGAAEKIRLSVDVLAPGAQALTTQEVVIKSHFVVLALPLSKYMSLPSSLLDNRLVIDAMNFWWEVDGDDDALKNPTQSSSESVQDYFKHARVVKALSHMGYHHLHDEAAPRTATSRKAIGIAGDDKADTRIIAEFVDRLGFDPLEIGNLAAGKILEPGMPGFGANVSRDELSKLLSM